VQGKWHAELSRASSVPDSSEASWEQIGMVFRVVYAIAMYGGLAFAGSVICNFTGVDLWGGFDLSPEVITTGFGYAVPPMMVLLFILEVCSFTHVLEGELRQTPSLVLLQFLAPPS
jgi:hypothetical protein